MTTKIIESRASKNMLKSIIEMAKSVIENFVPGGEGMIEVAERAIQLVETAKNALSSEGRNDQTEAELNEILAELRKRVNIKADETKDRLRGK